MRTAGDRQEERLQMRGFVSEPGRAPGVGRGLQRVQVEVGPLGAGRPRRRTQKGGQVQTPSRAAVTLPNFTGWPWPLSWLFSNLPFSRS